MEGGGVKDGQKLATSFMDGPLHPMLNKPERVFGLHVRCRELIIFKIRNFLRNVLDFTWIFLEDFFGRII